MTSISRLFLSSLLFVFVGGSTTAYADTQKPTWQQMSENGIFDVTLDPQADDKVEINQFLEWILTVKTADGKAVSPARISVGGGMPAHGHGLPSQPQVGEYLGEGKYLVKGVRFSMNGQWELTFDIQSEDQRDNVAFDLKIDY